MKKSEMKTRRSSTWRLTLAILTIFASGLLASGCSSLNPDIAEPIPTEEQTASYDGQERNSGIIEMVDVGFIVTQNFVERYNSMIEVYADRFHPKLERNDGVTKGDAGYVIDHEHIVYFLDMNQWRKLGL